MKFSIVTPSYNQGKYIGKTIKSVIEQKGNFEIEYFIMDGGSSDQTIDILKKYSRQLKDNKRIYFYWQTKKDKGQSDAINKGFKKATGDIFAFINSDDFYERGIFTEVSKSFVKHQEKMWLTGPSHIVNQDNQKIQKFITYYKNFWLKINSYTTLLVLNYISQPSTFFKKELFQKHGPFSEKLHYCMDYDFWLKIGKRNKPIIFKKYISNFRIHSTSKGKTSYKTQFQEDSMVASRYTQNIFLVILHKYHNFLIKIFYLFLKK